MPTISVSDAAKMYGISRRTIQRHIAIGRLTASALEHGKRVIDLSELIRAYGEPLHPLPVSPQQATTNNGQLSPPGSANDNARLDELLALVRAQGEQIEQLNKKIDEMQRRLPAPKAADGENDHQLGESSSPDEKTPETSSRGESGWLHKIKHWLSP